MHLPFFVVPLNPTLILSLMRLFLSSLTFQILTKIFKNLSVRDRKAVKLVCKTWFEICNQLPSTDVELFNCLGLYQLSETYQFLNKSERKFLNLKFNHVDFNYTDFINDSSFWKTNGPKIRSLIFQSCRIGNNVLVEIIRCCENLLHLVIKYTVASPDSKSTRISAAGLADGIVREKLRTLEIRTSAVSISDGEMLILFSMFPQIKVLRIPDQSWNHRSNRSVVNDYLMASKDRVEELEIFFPNSKLTLDDFQWYSKTLTDMSR